MLKKIGRFFEEHVEKMILAIVGILSFVLFLFFVLRSPNTFEVANDQGKTEKLTPGKIDEHIFQLALQLNQKPADPIQAPESSQESGGPRTEKYLALLDSAVGDIGTAPLTPESITTNVAAQKTYNVPQNIGTVTEVAVEHIRAAAYVPVEPISEQRTYDQVKHEPNDIDLVTVQGSFDIAALVNQFHESFVDQVPEEWADPCLAKPVFAAVNLQRRELTNDGEWSEWQNVPRLKIDNNKRLFELVQNEKNLSSSILQVQRLQFDNKLLQIDLLQPQAYQFASAHEDWYPPSIHPDYTAAMKKEMQREKQEARETEKQQDRTRETATRGSRTNVRGGGAGGRGDTGGGLYQGGTGTEGGRRGTTGGRRGAARGGDGLYTDGRTATTGGRASRGREGRDALNMEMMYQPDGTMAAQASPLLDVYREYNKIQLTWTTDLTKMREPLVFWAHDDTAEQAKTYQYRMRLGVFNPVAQTEQDKAILWSEFSDITNPVDIPGRLYFFANRQETAQTVTMTVCKYFLGYWRSADFRGIGPGGAIGGPVERKPEKPKEENVFVGAGEMGFVTPATTKPEDEAVEPEVINYDTGAVVVNVVTGDEWVPSNEGNLNVKPYCEVLYSFDGAMIEHMPVGLSNWPDKIRLAISTVQRLSNEKPEPFKQFGSTRTAQRGSEMYPGGRGGEDYMLEEMYMQGMQGRY